MISILTTTEKLSAIKAVIAGEYRMDELVTVHTTAATPVHITVGENIRVAPDWANAQPPLLFPDEPFANEALLGMIYLRLGNIEKALSLLTAGSLLQQTTTLLTQLISAEETETGFLVNKDDYVSLHNLAVASHYGLGSTGFSFEELTQMYQSAINLATDTEKKAFTTRQLAILLTDYGRPEEAAVLIENILQQNLPAAVTVELNATLSNALMQQLQIPYNQDMVERLKSLLQNCLQYYEQNNREPDAAMMLYEAAFIALIGNSYSEALGYITKAISIFEKNELVELTALAQLRKAGILKSWAQKNNPQFYRSAVQAYQEAIKVFNRENAPDTFAEIQHQLGIIYAAIPDEVKKKGIWASVAVSSFNEALSFYNKVDYPYQFAMICNNLGMAYTNFPQALHSDNFDKALDWYREALDIFDAVRFPGERSATLLNYINASWHVSSKSDFDEARYTDMESKAQELLSISTDEDMKKKAQLHLSKLQELKTAIKQVADN